MQSDELVALLRETTAAFGFTPRPPIVAGDGRSDVSFRSTASESGPVERNEGGRLPFLPLSQAIADQPDEPDWLWRGFIAPGNVTLVAGRPKVGKSTLTAGLFQALEKGLPFLELNTREAGILLLTEERAGTLAERARRFNLGDHIHVLYRHDARGPSWPEIVCDAVAYAQEHQLGLLAVDVIDKWTGLAGDSENSAGAVLEALEPVTWAASQQLAVMLVTHQRKSHGQYGEAVRGSNALVGSVDIIVEIERAPASLNLGDHARVLRAISRYSGTPDALVAILEDGTYEAAGDVAHAKTEAIRTQLLQTLTDEPATPRDLAEILDVSESTVRRYMAQLVNDGLAEQSGDGKRSDPYLWTRKLSTTPDP